jgi:hypothetical protein
VHNIAPVLPHACEAAFFTILTEHVAVLARYLTNTEWISGCYDGSVAMWSQLKKKPTGIHRGIHSAAQGVSHGPGCVDEEAAGWVQSVSVCPGSDLAVRTERPRCMCWMLLLLHGGFCG